MDQVERAGQRDERGFTVIEMVVALTIMGFSLMMMASVQFGALKALGASRQRSVFVEVGNAVMEQLRSLPEARVGVDTNDPAKDEMYPGGKYGGRAAVVLPAGSGAPAAKEVVTTSNVKGIVLPYTVRRWVTVDPGGSGQDLRRLEVRIDWTENGKSDRSLSLSSVWYPGGKGTDPATNLPPTLTSVTVTPGSGTVSQLFSFTASATDPEADGMTFSWQFGDATTGSGSTASHTYAAAGTYTALVEVRDTKGNAVTGTVNVPVSAPVNNAPTAQFTLLSGSTGPAPFTVNVSASGSSDPDGDALTYRWDWGDGSAAGSGVNAGHTYNAAGPYNIILTVADPAGATSTTAPQTITVSGGCTITSASFKNPGTNATSNDIKVSSSGAAKPVSSEFVFTARTNLYCPSVTWSLQTTSSSSRYTVTASSSTTSGAEKIWTITDIVPNSVQFPLGAMLTGYAGTSSTLNSFSFSFNAHL